MINIKKYGALKKLKKNQFSDHYMGYIADDELNPVKIVHFPSKYYNILRCKSIKEDIKNIASADSFFFPKIIEYKTKKNRHNMLEFIIVHELSSGISLKKFCYTEKRVDLTRFFKVAIQLALAVNEMHRLKIRFHGINISDIVVDSTDETVKIISIDSLIKVKEYLSLENENAYDILPYISPEQTGLLSIDMDYRSDFYILGTIFYELLTNQKIYYSKESEKIINAHIVKDPYAPFFINKLIPRTLSDIVMKLLFKDPCDRYQNTCCLIEDLKKCSALYIDKINMASFKIGENKACEEIFIPNKIYGREENLQQMCNGFDDVVQGSTKTMLITGLSGTGKTFLVNYFCRYVKKNRGLFIQTALTRYKKETPYVFFVNIILDLVKQILSESNNRITYFKNRLLQALGENRSVITDVIPEVEKIIGSQTKSTRLSATKAKNRFEQVFKNFIQVFADKNHPLVIFCDNVHWIDSASCKLGQLIFEDYDSSYIYCIAAGKTNDIKNNLKLTKTIEKFQKEDTNFEKLVLYPLNESSLNSLISGILFKNQNKTVGFSKVIYEISKGNPLITNQLISNLVSENLLRFNFNSGCWEYDLDKIKSKKYLFNCFDINSPKIKKLSDASLSILKTAACIGIEFDLKALIHISKKETGSIVFCLMEIVKEGFVKPVLKENTCFEELIKNNKQSGENLLFEFSHDNIQHDIYSDISKEKRARLHLDIGSCLLDKYFANVSEERLYEIVTHLNYGSQFINTKIKKDELAVLNFICAFSSRSCGAYDQAYEYMKKSTALLEPDSWKNSYDLTLSIFNEFAKSAYLAGKYHKLNDIIKTVFDNTISFMDKLKCYEIKILASIARDKPQQAVYTGLEVLSFLGVFFINDSNLPDLNKTIEQTKKLILSNGLDMSISISNKKNSLNIAVMQILAKIISPAYIFAPKLYPFIVFKMLNITALFGNFKESALAYVSFGIILTGFKEDFKEGYRLGEHAVYLVNNNANFKYRAKIFLLFNAFIKHWNHHLRDSFKNLKHAYAIGIETGDVEQAAYSAHFYAAYKYFSGIDLKSICREMAVQTANIKILKQKPAANLLSPYAQAAYNLYANVKDPCKLTGLFYDDEKKHSDLQKAKDWPGLYNFYLNKMILYYLFENYPKAVECADAICSFQASVMTTVSIVVRAFFDSLSRLAVLPSLSGDEKKRCLKIIDNNQTKMKKWSMFSASNTKHKYYLVAAEIEKNRENMVLAAEYYDLSADLAAETMYIQEAALANERAAIFYIKMGRRKIAGLYLEDALKYYKKWKAKTKIKYLEKKYSSYLSKHDPAASFVEKPTIDYNNILKIVQDMVYENVSADDIIIKLLNIVVSHFDVMKATFILVKKGDMCIRAHVSKKDKQAVLVDNISIKEEKNINRKIAAFVKKTRRFIVSNDSYLEDEVFKQPVLCLPVLNRREIFGIVYIEKSKNSDGFLPDHINFYLFLVFHLGVTLENSMLSIDLNQKGMALRESEKKYRTVTENTSELICVFDIKNLRVEYIRGSSIKDLIGYTSLEVQNIKLDKFLTPKSMEIAKEAIIKDLARERSKKGLKSRSRLLQIEFKCKNGSILKIDAVSSFFRNKDGHVSKVIVVCKNSEVKAASYEKEINKQVKNKTKALSMSLEKLKKEQNQLIQTKKMKALGELVAGVAHEINTPMGVGVTASSFIEYKAEEFLKKYSSKTLKENDIESFVTAIAQASSIVHSNLKRSVNLINDFKQVSVNKSSMQETTFSMKTCIEDVLLEIKTYNKKTVHEITVNCSDRVKIKNYKPAFSQIFKNIIMNSFIHGFNDTTEGKIEISVTVKGNNMFILYSDNGSGMDKKTVKKIFNPFFTTKRGIGKSGLGMHVVYNLITSTLNGTVFCFSKKERGAGFFIKIPLKKSKKSVSLKNF